MKFLVTADVDYVMGYLRYGHLEGVIECESEEELKEMIENKNLDGYLDLVVDSYEVEDCGDVGEYHYEVIE